MMPRTFNRCAMVALWGLAAAGPVAATAVAGPGGTAEQGRRLVQAEPAVGAMAPTLDLVSGRLEAVDPQDGSVTVRGQRVPLHTGQLRVLGAGGQALSLRSLRAGMQVRFALEPETSVPAASPAASASGTAARRIVLIYVDG